MSIANYLENKVLDKVFRNTDFTVSGAWVRLHTGDPGEDGTANGATETTRKSATFGSAASSGSISTTADMTWTSYPAAETITHISLWDASTAGNALWKGALTASRTLAIGNTFTISSGSLTITLD
ncbi:MAG: hypothetical protein EBR82_60985 [Caulobacteraceae bacterium]|nr:hypothetical protein [Caulobacteraceae bacterium]